MNLNGVSYEVQPIVYPILSDETAKFIGMAGPYKAYEYDPKRMQPNSIILHISDTEEVYAKCVIPAILNPNTH